MPLGKSLCGQEITHCVGHAIGQAAATTMWNHIPQNLVHLRAMLA